MKTKQPSMNIPMLKRRGVFDQDMSEEQLDSVLFPDRPELVSVNQALLPQGVCLGKEDGKRNPSAELLLFILRDHRLLKAQ